MEHVEGSLETALSRDKTASPPSPSEAEKDEEMVEDSFDEDVLGPVEDNIERVSCHELSTQDFIERFEIPCKPCVITGLLDRWPAKHKWSFQYFAEKYGAARFKCGEDDDGYKVKLRLDYFVHYLKNGAKLDDSPLYVFDADFGDDGKITKPMLDDFTIPIYFREDLYQYAGEEKRPPYRWVLLGPKRSGSSMHIDPLATSAWNAVLSGRKRWVLFPPGTAKSLVKPERWMAKKDREAIDWFLYHYKQNFVSTTSFPAVWLDSTTSRTKLSRRWLRELRTVRPDLYEIAQKLAGEGDGRLTAEQHLEMILAERKAKKEEKRKRKKQRKEEKKNKDRT
ncbi:hypothetical protein GUITHDRAFT_136376 [Guillardia theta CCMP2712]|uniref:JmjC domain-containing protein n=1 Tax=Guillardia theta (strain CCMP2712) TaxID=905079 RepID=L1JK13_GUITC|nr:hypothetical protein GUITHDRAFT_136376 [Guillardia theta CCMP2712]EKX48677.1 hypothetical protein GUITHDRAFT_136376 [Guillardia theta CCMP2712]|eukprot:XP_005835657.1 hypothetical protein GUITHDRAFT_136376 [Guillardia theta CCMP2712]